MFAPYNKRLLPVLLAFAAGLAACEEVTAWELQSGDNGQLVVEAILTDELKTQEVRLSRSYDAIDGQAPSVTDAQVRVCAANTCVNFQASTQEPGLYLSDRAFRVFERLEYRLEIDWQGQQYTAVSEMGVVAPIPLINFVSYGQQDSVTFGEFASIYNPNQQAMYEMNIDWSHLNQEGKNRAKMYFYTFNTIDVSELVRPVRDTVFFPLGSFVTARKFGLNDEYAAYLRALVIETQWKGGVFYSASADLPTNISGGALGFFSACAVEQRTVVAR